MIKPEQLIGLEAYYAKKLLESQGIKNVHMITGTDYGDGMWGKDSKYVCFAKIKGNTATLYLGNFNLEID